MSSHHVIREGQEPALIIANGAACSYSLLSSLLEWSPTIVVLDGAYHRVLELGIKPDVVIGDFDSIGSFTEMPDTQYLRIDRQDNTDLEKGIDYLLSKGQDQMNIVWATGERLDHTMHNLSLLAKYENAQIVVYDDLNKCYLLPKTFKKHYDKGDPISLIPVGLAEGIRTSGLLYNLENESLQLGMRTGSSNTAIETGLVQIEYTHGHLILMESYDRKSKSK
ncbi:thiamine diphosphokinase [bacterium]|nr:thiamine diphosphokinase [bacterium]